jgi:hypothetical protein
VAATPATHHTRARTLTRTAHTCTHGPLQHACTLKEVHAPGGAPLLMANEEMSRTFVSGSELAVFMRANGVHHMYMWSRCVAGCAAGGRGVYVCACG